MRFRSKPLLAGAFAVAAALAAAPALSDVTEYQGGGFLTDFSNACAPDWPAGGTVQANLRLRPMGEPDYGPDHNILNIFIGNLAMHIQVGELAVNETRTAQSYIVIGGGVTVDPTPMPSVRALAAPAGTVLNAGDELHLLAEIADFALLPGCRVRASFWLHRR